MLDALKLAEPHQRTLTHCLQVLGPLEEQVHQSDEQIGRKVKCTPAAGRSGTDTSGEGCNMTLRWALVELACRAAYLDERWGRYYGRMKAKKAMVLARAALARKLVKMIYIMLKHEVDYRDYMQRGNLAR